MSVWDSTTNIELLGVTFLGIFVGFMLTLTLRSAKSLRFKSAVAILGAALSGAPVVFLSDLGFQKWMYPIGLVLGSLWVRVPVARQAVAQKRDTTVPAFFAWFDLLAIAAITSLVLLLAAIVRIKP